MRLPDSRAFALSLATVLAACGPFQGVSHARSAPPPLPRADTGPAADYPMVLGDPFVVDGVTYTPQDKLNFDQVGYAGIGDGEGISVSHRTLPLPSYAEVTSLETGRTILVRVTRRGPMTGARTIDLSPAAAQQLGAGSALTPIRIRRVNPPEQERAMLRSGGQAPVRMDTPKSLVAVLLRKLDGGQPLNPGLPKAAEPAAQPAPAAAPAPAVTPAKTEPAKPRVAPPAATVVRGSLIVQVGAFSNGTTAQKVAEAVGGRVFPIGKLFRVRTGPFTSAAAAQAGLAKAKAAGYSEARIQHAE